MTRMKPWVVTGVVTLVLALWLDQCSAKVSHEDVMGIFLLSAGLVWGWQRGCHVFSSWTSKRKGQPSEQVQD